jgi:hypothetical protein
MSCQDRYGHSRDATTSLEKSNFKLKTIAALHI